jgi:hypothetical protein
MQIMRLTLTGVAAAVLASMLAAGAADPASAATPICKGRNQVLVNGQCVPDRLCNGLNQVLVSGQCVPDRQMMSRGYRRHHKRHKG